MLILMALKEIKIKKGEKMAREMLIAIEELNDI